MVEKARNALRKLVDPHPTCAEIDERSGTLRVHMYHDIQNSWKLPGSPMTMAADIATTDWTIGEEAAGQYVS
jgi:hypothetical protein